MQRITPQTNRRLHKLLNQSGLADHKPELVRKYSEIDSPSSRDLLETEARKLCKHLQDHVNSMGRGSKSNQMRRKIISMLRSINFERKDQNGCVRADMHAIYNYIEKHGYLHPKKLDDYSELELPKLVTQIEKFTGNRAEEFKRYTRSNGKKEG